MQTINILSTRQDLVGAAPYSDEERAIRFGLIDPRKLVRPVDGSCWIFIDWVLPEYSGIEFCQVLRADARWADSHISLILEDDAEEDRKRAMRAGADGYLTGPVTRQSLLDRVLSVSSIGAVQSQPGTVVAGPLSIDPGAMQARWKKRLIRLSPGEFRLLHFLARNPNRLHSRQDLIAGLGRSDEPIDDRTVDAWISRLRRALRTVGASGMLRTIRSRGYMLEIA